VSECNPTPGQTPTTISHTSGPIGLSSLFRDWRNQISWGRICAAVALVVAVWREFTGADLWHVALWLGVATGSYGISKGTEVVALLKHAGSQAQPASGPHATVLEPSTETAGAKIEAQL